MKWYEDLFVGESVTGKIKKIKWKIEHNAGMLHTYIITFPSNEENLLDIIPTRELLQKRLIIITRYCDYVQILLRISLLQQFSCRTDIQKIFLI